MSPTLIFALLLTLSAVTFGQSQNQDCGPNEVYNSCGSSCPDTCETVLKGNKYQQTCTMQCVSGCFCRDGLVKDGSGKCVSTDVCRHKEPVVRDRDTDSDGSSAISGLTIRSQFCLFITFSVFAYKYFL